MKRVRTRMMSRPECVVSKFWRNFTNQKDTQSEEDWVRKQGAPNYGIRTLSQIKLGNKVLLIHDTEAIADKILGLEVGAFRPGPF